MEAISRVSGKGQNRLLEKLNDLETQKEELELDIVKLKIAQDIRITEKEVKAWLKQFTKGDPNDPDFRKQVIALLVNSVYLFDDHMVIFFNVSGTKKVCFTDSKERLEDDLPLEKPSKFPSAHFSDLKAFTRAKSWNSRVIR